MEKHYTRMDFIFRGTGTFYGIPVKEIREKVCELVMWYDLTRTQALMHVLSKMKFDQGLSAILDVNSGTVNMALKKAKEIIDGE